MKILLLLFSILIISTAISQTTTIVNQKTYGGDLTDVLSDLVVLNDGSYVLSGFSESGVFGNKTTPNYGMNDGWVVNVNLDLTINWQLNIGGTDDDFLIKSLATNDGGFVIAGSSSSPISGNKTSPNKGGSDIWVVKLSNAGVIEWQNTYGGSGDDNLSSISIFIDGNYIICGSSESPISGDKSEASRGGVDYWLLKIRPNGTVIWEKTVGGDQKDRVKDVIIDDNQNVFIVGESKSSLSGEKTENNYGSENIWLLKLDSAGIIIWDKTIGGNSFEQNPTVKLMSNKLYISSTSDSPASGNKTAINNGLTDFWLVSLDTNANILWDKTYGGSSIQSCFNTIKISENRLIMVGNSDSDISGTKTESNQGFQDMWLVMVDSIGEEIWQKTIGGSQYDALQSIYKVANNHYIFAGTSWSDIGGDKTENVYGWSDYWLLELTTNLGLENVSESIHYKVYPNPSQGQFVLTGLNLKSDITIYNIQGKVIKKLNSKEQKSLNINLTDVTKGIYLINIRTNHSNKTLKLLIK